MLAFGVYEVLFFPQEASYGAAFFSISVGTQLDLIMLYIFSHQSSEAKRLQTPVVFPCSLGEHPNHYSLRKPLDL